VSSAGLKKDTAVVVWRRPRHLSHSDVYGC
jgi:hypothetical protein